MYLKRHANIEIKLIVYDIMYFLFLPSPKDFFFPLLLEKKGGRKRNIDAREASIEFPLCT